MRVRKGDAEKDFSFREDEILNTFIKIGSSFLAGMNNAFDCVAHAQHFGLPTRLIDWSKNPLVSLFFAVYYADRKGCNPQLLCVSREKTIPIREPIYLTKLEDFDISGLNPIRDYQLFLEQLTNGEFIDIVKKYGEIVLEMSDDSVAYYQEMIESRYTSGYMIFIETGYSNPRLVAQDGVFHLPKYLKESEIISEYEKSQVELINIDPAWKDDILSYLSGFGISKDKLFFDIASICEYIKESQIDIDKMFLVQ